jgi:phage-related protein
MSYNAEERIICFVRHILLCGCKPHKTPKREIEQAKRELADWIERGGANEN